MDDEAISSFAAITGAAPHVARHYMSLTDGNMEQAIQLFFDSPELASMADAPSAPALPSQASRPAPQSSARPNDAAIIQIDSDDDMDEDFDDADDRSPRPAVNSHYEDDEAMARRMQEEMYGAGGPQGGAGFGGDDVRAPIARTTETLVGPGSHWGDTPEDVHDAVLEQLRRRTARGGPARPGVFNQQAGPSIWDDSNPDARRAGLAEATGGASEANSKAARLAELFRPPFDLMCRLPWEDARDKGKEEEKWILVNIQDPSIFDCQALNRDIWKHEGIRETVQSNFVFMQYSKDDPRGNQYMQYYFPLRDSDTAFPHIAIVDPRTGEQVKLWSGRPVPKPMDFLMQLHEFLDRYSLDATAKNPVARRKAEKPAAMDVERLSEEQQMELALKASMTNEGEGPKHHDPDELTKDPANDSTTKGKGKESDEETMSNDDTEAEAETQEASLFGQISFTSPHTEPADNPATTTRIQFRHSGGRVIHRFELSDTVRRLYEWLKAEPIKEGVEFELKSMGKDLIHSLDATVADAQLKNGTVMIEYLED